MFSVSGGGGGGNHEYIGEILSTMGDVWFIREILRFMWEYTMSTSGEVQYVRGLSRFV